MSEPVDPNAAPYPWASVEYQPPPPFVPPPSDARPAPYPQMPPMVGSMWVLGPDGVLVPAPPPQQPPDRRRRNLVIAIAAIVVLAAGGIIAAVLVDDGASPHHRLSIPASFDGYDRVNGSTARQVESTLRGMGSASSAASMFDAATIGSYAHDSGDEPRLVILVVPTGKVPESAGDTPDEVTRGILTVASPVTRYPAGPHGGSSMCGNARFGAVREIMCAWADPTTTGLMVSVLTPMTPGGLSAIEQDFRDLVD